MAIIKCANGHFYNTDFYVECPFCQSASGTPSWESDRRTEWTTFNDLDNTMDRTSPMMDRSSFGRGNEGLTVSGTAGSASSGHGSYEEDEGVTMSLPGGQNYESGTRGSYEEDEGVTVPLSGAQRYEGPSHSGYADDEEVTVPLSSANRYKGPSRRSYADDEEVTVPLSSANRYGSMGSRSYEEDEEVTVPLSSAKRYESTGSGSYEEDEEITSPLSGADRDEDPSHENNEEDEEEEDREQTVAILPGQRMRVTGWLVCLSGELRGRDFRIYEGNNWIGSGSRNDICLQGASGVEENNHCSIIYDRKHIRFYLMPGKGSDLSLNGRMADSRPVNLSKGDRIMIGAGEYEFFPFCREGHSWKK